MAKPDERFVFQPLKTARLQLILPEPADALRLVRYYEENKQHFAPWQSLRSEEFYTEAFWLAEIARLRDDFRSDRGLTVVLVDNFDPEGKVLGQISLMNIKLICPRTFPSGSKLSTRTTVKPRSLRKSSLNLAISANQNASV